MMNQLGGLRTRLLAGILVFGALAFVDTGISGAPAPPIPPATGSYQFDFNGSSDGLSFDIVASGSSNGSSMATWQYHLSTNDFGNFIIPEFLGKGWGNPVTGTGSISTTAPNFTATELYVIPGSTVSAYGGGMEFNTSIVVTVGGINSTLSGSLTGFSIADFNLPGVTTFEELFRAGSYSALLGDYNYTLNFNPYEVEGTTESPQEEMLVTNNGAINSTMTTGVNSMTNTLGNTQNAANNAVGDLNNRLFRARSRGGNTGGGVNVAARDHTTRFLNFAARNNIDHRVALGLARSREVRASAKLEEDANGEKQASSIISVEVEAGASAKNPAKNPYDGKVVIGEEPETDFEIFTSFDYGFYDQDNISASSRAFNTDTYSGTAGFERRLNSWLYAGAAFTYLNSDTDLTADLGSNDLEGEVYSTYFTAFQGNTYLDFLYSYGDFDNEIRRNTLLGSFAEGDTTSSSHNFSMNTGHTIRKSKRFSFGPSAGLDYTTGQVNGYTERGGGLANLIYPDHDFESIISRLGAYATFENKTRFGWNTTQLRAGWAHEYSPENGNVTASLQTSPFALVTGGNAQSVGGFTVNQRGEHAGTDWLEVGATTRLDFQDSGAYLELGYQGMLLRENATGHYGSAKLGYEW
ncbi:autotransporter outer membrane beta-barrel domain-containing protein [Verrucomicrobiales bacterium BCK34]|nr:autotransporter outer membrane beta-barrel domain-containing protein [Verrucomicrobiales bacterium BCK34]